MAIVFTVTSPCLNKRMPMVKSINATNYRKSRNIFISQWQILMVEKLPQDRIIARGFSIGWDIMGKFLSRGLLWSFLTLEFCPTLPDSKPQVLVMNPLNPSRGFTLNRKPLSGHLRTKELSAAACDQGICLSSSQVPPFHTDNMSYSLNS